MVATFSLWVVWTLLVFFLYLLVRPQYAVRPAFVCGGMAAVVLAVIGSFFQAWGDTWARVLVAVFSVAGAILALVAAAMATCKCESCEKPQGEQPAGAQG